MLGAVSCTFRHEIKPYQRYEIWSRILCWDRKWVYIVSHFVKKGRVKPKGYTLQPLKNMVIAGRTAETKLESDATRDTPGASSSQAIFASAISKYVFKTGRLTIPPERILEAAGLLPPKPAGHQPPPVTPSPETPEGTVLNNPTASLLQNMSGASVDGMIDASLLPSGDDGVWDWAKVEDERLRGLKIVDLMAGLDSLQDEFTAEKGLALGEF